MLLNLVVAVALVVVLCCCCHYDVGLLFSVACCFGIVLCLAVAGDTMVQVACVVLLVGLLQCCVSLLLLLLW